MTAAEAVVAGWVLLALFSLLLVGICIRHGRNSDPAEPAESRRTATPARAEDDR